ncbi:MAG: pyrroline-5-carboxylate reductase dimerization domain-containing protein [Pseudomonadota bacterium]
MTFSARLGIIGGGALGGAIARRLLSSGAIAPERLWVVGRSDPAARFSDWPGLRTGVDPQALADGSDAILLAVPPDAAAGLRIEAADRLIVSVMAGVRLERLQEITGSARAVRAMSSPVAERGLAYSPWFASAAVGEADRTLVRALFEPCGLTDEIFDENQIDQFTALTGPVPGFVAFLADCMVQHARARGIDAAIADRAVRQLFLASGAALGQEASTPAEQVQAMIDYAGTTAAGLEAMRASGIAAEISAGLDAAAERARTIAGD